MKLPVLAAVALAVLAPVALGAFPRPDPQRTAFPPAWEQHRAIARILARGEAVYCGGGHGDAVALTFDDGPGPYTEQIASILGGAGAHATFFVVGNRIQYWPQGVREEAQLGGIGNHSCSHPHLTGIAPFLVWLELLRTQYTLDETVGWKPRIVRVPYANHSREVDELARRMGLLEVFWDVDARDDVPNAKVKDIVRNVVRGLRPGAIVILHEIHPWTVEALPQILDAVRARGLRAVSVPELLALDPPAPGQGCPYAPVAGD